MLVRGLVAQARSASTRGPFPRHVSWRSDATLRQRQARHALRPRDRGRHRRPSQGSGFKVFREALERGGVVRGLKVPRRSVVAQGPRRPRRPRLATFGAKGLAWIRDQRGRLAVADRQVPFDDEKAQRHEPATGARGRAISCSVADERRAWRPRRLAASAPAARRPARHDRSFALELPVGRPTSRSSSGSSEEKRVGGCHIIRSPRRGTRTSSDPRERPPSACAPRPTTWCSTAYELGGGSIRIHRPDVQAARFLRARNSGIEARVRSSASCSTRWRYGAPPHGGIALGLDRWRCCSLARTRCAT